MADVVAFFGKIFTSNIISIKIVFSNKLIFLKTPFLKNLKKFIVIAPSIRKILDI